MFLSDARIKGRHAVANKWSFAQASRDYLAKECCTLPRMASSSFQYTRADSWSNLSPSSGFYYRPSAEILAGGYRIASVLPGRQGDSIQCRIQEVSLKDTSVRFIALPYCWNSTTAEEVIWVDGRPLKVTFNLYAALRNARATTTVVNLWIDQQNIIDRN
ncbi:hypothetical protein AC579_2202 [Pseudocercospora musae]|uniref:Heterokaryon incompatibility domain-containing protein n=1 Tax=Pseudocercospora musae TaxID=113226 RepID=A0A139IKR1_9PEZI|nr:hypothetical protein AC579_2202 [Pseudocercospora musae]